MLTIVRTAVSSRARAVSSNLTSIDIPRVRAEEGEEDRTGTG